MLRARIVPLLLAPLALALAVLVALALWVGARGMAAKRHLAVARSEVQQIELALRSGDVATARAALGRAQRSTEAARRLTGDLAWRLTEHVPFAGRTPRAVRTLTAVVDTTADRTLGALVSAGATLQPKRLRLAGHRIALAPLAASRAPLGDAASAARAAHAAVARVETKGLVAPVARARHELSAQLAELARLTSEAARVADLAPAMLGAKGPRRYFVGVLGINEARGVGGIVGSYAIVEARDGAVRVLRMGTDADLKVLKPLPHGFGADYSELHNGATVRFWQNTAESPHFPYAGDLWLRLWRQQRGERLDGAISLDPVVMSHVLSATGPTRLSDGTAVTADNVVPLTLQQAYARFPDNAQRKAFLQHVARQVLDVVLQARADPVKLVRALGQSVAERRLLVYSAHPDEQRRLEQTALAGALPGREGPFAMLVVNNSAQGKLDYYLDRRLTYRLGRCLPDGERESRIEVALTNAAPRGLPAYVETQRESEAKGPPGTNYALVYVYLPVDTDVTAATLDGKPLLLLTGQERGHPVAGTMLPLPRGRTRTLSFDLVEPAVPAPPTVPVQPLVRAQQTRVAAGTSCG